MIVHVTIKLDRGVQIENTVSHSLGGGVSLVVLRTSHVHTLVASLEVEAASAVATTNVLLSALVHV